MNRARYLPVSVSLALLLLLVVDAHTAPGRGQPLAGKVAAVFQTVRNEKLTALKALLQSGAPVDSAESSGKTALMVAVDCCETKSQTANLPAAELLLKHGANPNLRDATKRTAIFYAIDSESVPAVRLLIRHGAKVNIEAEYGSTPLEHSIERRQTTIPQVLLEAGAKARGLRNDNSPLMAAAAVGNVAVAKLLLSRGATVTQATNGTTALHIAAKGNNPAMVKFLLAKGARVNGRDDRGETPLLGAMTFGDYETINTLLKAGANPNIADEEGATPLTYASIGFSPNSLKIMRALLDKGANPNLGPQGGGGPLTSAARSGSVELVRLLLQKGADPRRGRGDTPLHGVLEMGNHFQAQIAIWGYGGEMTEIERRKVQSAAETADLAIVQALLEKGASVSKGAEKTLLIDAAELGNAGIVKLMLQKGADPNISDSAVPIPPQIQQMLKSDPEAAQRVEDAPELFGLPTGKTPLLAAAENGHAEVVAALLQAGAEPSRGDKRGRTPLLALAGAGRSKIARELPVMREGILHRADESNPKPVSREVKPAEKVRVGQWADIGDVAIIQALVAKGANVDARDKQGCTPLMLAARLGRPAVVRSLLDNGADINALDNKGRSALMQVITSGRRQNAPQLFSRELETELRMVSRQRDDEDPKRKQRAESVRTAAKKQHAAVYEEAVAGDLAMLTLLKERGADLTSQDKTGLTALQLARQWKYEAALKFLSAASPG